VFRNLLIAAVVTQFCSSFCQTPDVRALVMLSDTHHVAVAPAWRRGFFLIFALLSEFQLDAFDKVT